MTRNAWPTERDSLVASLEATKPCEPCQRDDHDNCTGDCSSMCCALAAAERERDSALADLAALRGKVEEAVVRCEKTLTVPGLDDTDPAMIATLGLLAILAPEGPDPPNRQGPNWDDHDDMKTQRSTTGVEHARLGVQAILLICGGRTA